MKQIAQYQDGRLELQEVPKPVPPPGGILVRTTHSVISVGTEKMKVEQANMNLLQKARARPDQVRKVLDTARTLGWKSALQKVRNRLESPTGLGYSAAGVVEAVDPLNTRYRAGDLVACGGAECAFHAEYIAIPDMLSAPVPSGVEGWQAAYTTVASIALQAVRQLAPTLGERILVMGQGLIGLLVTNILAANGARVMAVDLLEARRSRCQQLGAERVVIPGAQNLDEEVRDWTEGYGVDGVVLCTATASNTPIEQSVNVLRDRGRLIIVGNTKADLAWKTFYEKEISVAYSRSYGPGRYDPPYEWGGTDYPIGYVRWTERRNFEACLHLMKQGRLNLEALTTRTVPFAESLKVYQALLQEGASDVGVVLEYGADAERTPTGDVVSVGEPESVEGRAGDAPASEPILAKPVTRLDVIGAGNFARTMLLPHLKGRLTLGTVVNQTALSANHVRTKFGFQSAATDPGSLYQDAEPGAVLIATRHHLHAPMVEQALQAGRHVFVEKPLCLTEEELGRIDGLMARGTGSVMVGFNRRFAPASAALKALLDRTTGPKSASFRVMPGRLDPQHWYAHHEESGGRVLGEACHFLDYFCFLFGSEPVKVFAQTTWPARGRLPFPDSVTAQVSFADDSSGQLIYSAEGDTSWPKEVLTVMGAGMAAELVNFQKLTVHQRRRRQVRSFNSKGHAEEMAAWSTYLLGKGPHPLPYAASRRSMRLTFAVLASIREGRAAGVRLD